MFKILDQIYEASTANQIYGMGDTTFEDIESFVIYRVQDILSKNDLDIDILEISLCGSRSNPNPHKDADLDVIMYYNGEIDKNDLADILHAEDNDEILTYDKVYIDIKPEKE